MNSSVPLKPVEYDRRVTKTSDVFWCMKVRRSVPCAICDRRVPVLTNAPERAICNTCIDHLLKARAA